MTFVHYVLVAPEQPPDGGFENWSSPLFTRLGTPESVSTWSENGPGRPIYNVEWNLFPVRVGFTVTDDVRKGKQRYSASLYLDWKDEIPFAKEDLKRNRLSERRLFSHIKKLNDVKVFHLSQIQHPVCMPDYSHKNPYGAALTNDLLRQSQRAFYWDDVFETPEVVKQLLTQQSFAIWKYPEPGTFKFWKRKKTKWCISTLWDTTLFEQTDADSICFSNLLPAKGEGGSSLSVKNMSLNDISSSVPLMEAFREIETVLGEKLCFEESDDC